MIVRCVFGSRVTFPGPAKSSGRTSPKLSTEIRNLTTNTVCLENGGNSKVELRAFREALECGIEDEGDAVGRR